MKSVSQSLAGCALDLLDHFPRVRGRDRFRWKLAGWVCPKDTRTATLPNGARVPLEIKLEYERSIWLGMHKVAELTFLDGLLRPGDCFVDVGANIGLWSLTAAKKVGAAGNVYAFEPNPTSFERLTRAICLNGFEAIVKPRECAVGHSTGVVHFKAEHEHYLSRLSSGEGDETIPVDITSLDEAGSGLTRVDGLKVDVEGHEAAVFRGARSLIERFRPWICVEFHGGYQHGVRLGDWEIYQTLGVLGYRCFRLGSAGGDFQEELSPKTGSSRRAMDLLFRAR